MTRQTLQAAVIVGLLFGAVTAAFLDPAARVGGWVRGEPFYRGRAAAAWERALTASKAHEHVRAAGELADGGADAVPVLRFLLQSGQSAEVRRRAAEVLGQIGPAARSAGPDLLTSLHDPDSNVQRSAAWALEQMAPDVPGAVPALITAFPQIEAIRAVAHYEAAEAVPHLIPLLRHNEPAVRWNAARSLGKLRVAAAVPDLVAALTDDQAAVREHAAEALGEIGPAAAEAVPALITALSDPDCRVRRDAVRSLGQIGPAAKSALSAVEARSRDDNDVAVRAAAERALRLIDPGHSDSGDKK